MVLLWIMLPYITFFNLLIFGNCIFDSVAIFLRLYLYSVVYIVIVYFFFGIAAAVIKKRFSEAGDMFRRLVIILPMFYIMNILSVSGIYYIYAHINAIPCPVHNDMLIWTILYGCIMSTVITFINEGVANWEAWKSSLLETENLSQAYQRSRLLGLKGQINPHFLFNCFNTLSGLIQEDESKAEQFLDEMTKVHRYLLSSDDEHLTSLDNEIKFARSYLFLAKERFGSAIQFTINIAENDLNLEIPLLSMQILLENIFYGNALSKSSPLNLIISSTGHQSISIWHSKQKRSRLSDSAEDPGLLNLIQKYTMMKDDPIEIRETQNERTILIHLFSKPEGIT